MPNNTVSRRRRNQRGNFLVEFAFSMALLLVPLFLGVTYISFGLGRSIQVESVCRDAGNMYSRGVDFSITGNKELLATLGEGIGLQPTSGAAVVYLTQVTYVTATDCTAAGLPQPCANQNAVVVLQRQVVGDRTLGTSAMANPSASLLDSQGNISPQNYMRDASAKVPSMGAPGCTSCVASLNPGEVAWIAEVRVGPVGNVAPAVYARDII